MRLVREINGQITNYSLKRLYADHPNVSFPKLGLTEEFLKQYGVSILEEKPDPVAGVDYDPATQKVTYTPIQKKGNGYFAGWIVEDLGGRAIEVAARAERDKRLQQSDIDMLKLLEQNATGPEDTDLQLIIDQLKDYRQQLRDVPEQDGWPDNIDWPILP